MGMQRMIVRALVAGLFGVAVLTPSVAKAFQTCANWSQPSNSIPNAAIMYDGAAAYDSARDRVVMFGGIIGFQNVSNRTWEYNGSTSAWVQMAGTGPVARWYHSMAYDSGRGVTVLFGGTNSGGVYYGDTWEWNGSTWTQRLIAGPSARSSAAMTYDSVRGRIVLFGGGNASGYLGDIWEYNGVSWANVTPGAGAALPTARSGAGLAYDSFRQKTVMFGGGGAAAPQRPTDTWEWNGSVWTEPPPMDVLPPGRTQHSMVYDALRKRVVIYGGESNPNALDDTWEYDGQAWVQLSSGYPSVRWGCSTAYDSLRGRVVICGGIQNGAIAYDDTYAMYGDATPIRIVSQPPNLDVRSGGTFQLPVTIAYNGPAGAVTYQWQKNGFNLAEGAAVSGSNSPQLQVVQVLSGDSGSYRCIINGPCGQVIAGPADVSIGGCSSEWVQGAIAGPNPRSQHAMAFCGASGKTVMYGGNRVTGTSADTWDYDVAGPAWTFRPGANPPGRTFAGMSADSTTGYALLFGGQNAASVTLADTWFWNGAAWTQLNGSLNPTARSGPVMAYDPARNLSVVGFGIPVSSGVPLADSYQMAYPFWNPTNVTGPRARNNAHMAYSSGAGGLVLFGGVDRYGNLLGDTWRLNASGWTKLTPSCSPSPRAAGQMVAKAGTTSVLLFGGVDSTLENDTWEFDGLSWRKFVRSVAPPARIQGGLSYDTPRRTAVLFGGLGSSFNLLGDTWHWQHDVAPSMMYSPAPDVVALAGTSVQFSFLASGSPGPYYQWYFNNNPIYDSGPYSGTQTNTLTINPVAVAHAGHYECTVYNACGAYRFSPFFDLHVKCNVADIVSVGGNPPPDGLLTPDDYIAFINAFSAYDLTADIVSVGGLPPPDGLLTGDDFNAFINAFSNGCP